MADAASVHLPRERPALRAVLVRAVLVRVAAAAVLGGLLAWSWTNHLCH
jgi:hypothetical protein